MLSTFANEETLNRDVRSSQETILTQVNHLCSFGVIRQEHVVPEIVQNGDLNGRHSIYVT